MSTRIFNLPFLSIISSSLLLLFLINCEKSTEPVADDSNPLGRIVTNNITDIAPFNEIAGFKKGTKMKLRINRDGFIVREYEVVFEGISVVAEEHLIICRTPGDIIIGSGDSGSPILTEDSRVAGALCYGFTGNNNQFAARSIEDLLSLSENSNVNLSKHSFIQKNSSLFEPIKLSYFFIGYDEEYITHYTQENGYNPFTKFDYMYKETFYKQSLSKYQTNVARDTSLIPGMSIAVLEIYGDLIIMGAVGTASYINDNNEIFAFGHEYWARHSYCTKEPPCFIADMRTMNESSTSSSKVADPTSIQIGSLVRDDLFGILINENHNPQMFPVVTSVDIDSTGVKTYSHLVSNYEFFNDEIYMAGYTLTYPIYREIIRRGGFYPNVASGSVKITVESIEIDSSFVVDSYSQPVSYMIWDFITSVYWAACYKNQDRCEPIKGIELTVNIYSDSLLSHPLYK